MANTRERILELLNTRKHMITAFINTRSFSDDAVVNERQKDKKECAMYYLEELQEVISVVSSSKENSHFSFVSDETFENCGKSAAFCTIEFDGIYFQIKRVTSMSDNDIKVNFYIYAFPISKILL